MFPRYPNRTFLRETFIFSSFSPSSAVRQFSVVDPVPCFQDPWAARTDYQTWNPERSLWKRGLDIALRGAENRCQISCLSIFGLPAEEPLHQDLMAFIQLVLFFVPKTRSIANWNSLLTCFLGTEVDQAALCSEHSRWLTLRPSLAQFKRTHLIQHDGAPPRCAEPLLL